MDQFACTLRLIHGPRHDDIGDRVQRRDGLCIEQTLVYRDAVELAARETTQEAAKLPLVSDRVHAANRVAHERVEHAPAAGANRESTATEVRLDGSEGEDRESLVSSFEVEHELCLVGRRGEQLVQLQSWPPRRYDLPAIPQYGQRACRLQVTDLEPSAVEPDVGFRERRTEVLSCPQVGESIACAVRDEERVLPAVGEPRRELPTHLGGV